LGYMYLLMGIISSPAVFPVAFTITWKKQSAMAAIVSSIVGVICGIIAWLVTAKKLFDEITIQSTGDNYPIVSILVPLIITVIWSSIFPDNFDFDITRTELKVLTDDEVNDTYKDVDPAETDPVRLKKAFQFALWCSIILTIILVILWPLPMYFSRYVFSRPFFTFWVAISMIWAICGAIAVAIFPVVEARQSIFRVIKGVFLDITRRGTGSVDEIVEVKHDTVNNEKVTKV
ncbi:14268_t:CDS:2, partial [Ambispora leptoticha]